ncbi:MAG: hypothetical protein KY468_09145 [Armatimonadetes bacterium]|nr:hypothetical protein [Armatimonadota bacterium]
MDDPAPQGKPVFFIDRAIESRILIRDLIAAGALIERHMDHFVHDEDDPVWLSEVGKKGWYVLTRDEDIRYDQIEKEALKRAGVGFFVVVSKNLSGRQMSNIIVNMLPTLEELATSTPRPFIIRVYRDGTYRISDEEYSDP